MLPVILLVAPEHADVLTDEFGRYRRDYEIRTTGSASEAERCAREVVGSGGTVALVVSESRLPDGSTYEALARWRAVV
ncbi:MAG: FAD-dependent oxidoreductase, partial [Phycicoccus sp.]